jgi:hypothetical protein
MYGVHGLGSYKYNYHMIMTMTPPHTPSMFKTSGVYFEKEGGHCSLYKRLNICCPYPCTPYIVASIKDSIFVTHVLHTL